MLIFGLHRKLVSYMPTIEGLPDMMCSPECWRCKGRPYAGTGHLDCKFKVRYHCQWWAESRTEHVQRQDGCTSGWEERGCLESFARAGCYASHFRQYHSFFPASVGEVPDVTRVTPHPVKHFIAGVAQQALFDGSKSSSGPWVGPAGDVRWRVYHLTRGGWRWVAFLSKSRDLCCRTVAKRFTGVREFRKGVATSKKVQRELNAVHCEVGLWVSTRAHTCFHCQKRQWQSGLVVPASFCIMRHTTDPRSLSGDSGRR